MNGHPRVAPIATGIVAVFAFVALLGFPNAVPDNTLDSSWSAALSYFFRERLLAGVDYIFTYGPLGFLLTAYYDPRTFYLKWLYEVSLKAYIVWEVIRLCRFPDADGHRPAWWRGLVPLVIAGVMWSFAVYPGFVYTTDASTYVVLLVLGTAPVVDRGFGGWRLAVTVLIVALLSLAKATLMVVALPVIFVCALRVGSRETRSVIWKSPAILFPVVWLVLWFLLGQRFGNIAPYFLGSFSVSSGYNDAMAFATPEYRNSLPPLGAAITGIICLLVALRIQGDALSGGKRPTALHVLYLCLVALVVLLAWKHGFTRGGNHTLITFLTLGFAAPFLWAVLPGGARPLPRTVLLGVATLCALFGALLGDDGWFHRNSEYPPLTGALRTLFNPVGAAGELDAKREANRSLLALPEVKQTVGRESVAIWSYEQGVLLLNDLRYRPHPSLQGYGSYTRYLQQKDLTFWASDAAPPFLLFKPQTIDLRYPNLDAGPAFAGLLQRYAPMLTESGYFLMRRREPVVPLSEINVARDRAVKITSTVDKWVDVPAAAPNTLQMISIMLKPTAAGVVRKLLFKPAEVLLGVRGGESEKPRVSRILPSMAAQGFVLNPRLQNDEQVAMLYAGVADPTPVRQIIIALPPDAQPCFAPEVEIRFFSVPFAPTSPEGNP